MFRNSRSVLVIIECEVLKCGNEVGNKIGSPIDLAGTVKPRTSDAPTLSPAHVPERSATQSIPARQITPISELTPYRNKWQIKARVAAKPPIRHWSNAKGQGKLFNFDLIDGSGEIRVTVFHNLVDKFYDVLEVFVI